MPVLPPEGREFILHVSHDLTYPNMISGTECYRRKQRCNRQIPCQNVSERDAQRHKIALLRSQSTNNHQVYRKTNSRAVQNLSSAGRFK